MVIKIFPPVLTRFSGNNLLFSLLVALPQNHFLHIETKFGDNNVICSNSPFPTFNLCSHLIGIERIKSLFPSRLLHECLPLEGKCSLIEMQWRLCREYYPCQERVTTLSQSNRDYRKKGGVMHSYQWKLFFHPLTN